MMDYDPDDLRKALERFRAGRDISVNRWAQRAGISESAYRNFMRGESTTLQQRTLHKLAAAFGLTIHEMLNPSDFDQSLVRGDVQLPGEMIPLQEIVITVDGGPGALAADDKEAVRHTWVVPKALVRPVTDAPAERIKIITVRGNSMVPLFNPGDKVMVDTEDRVPSPPGVFVIWDGIGQVIKEVEYLHDDDRPMVRLISKNPDYEPRLEPAAALHINGRVIGKWMWT